MTTDQTRPEVDDPRVLALAQARQHRAYSNPFNAGFCPPWDGLTEQEQHLSLLDARNYLRAAIDAGLVPAVSAPVQPPATRADAWREAAAAIDATFTGPDRDRYARYAADLLRRMADEEQPATDLAAADNPTPLRWGLHDVLWGDDDTVTVLLSGPTGEPYWLELDPERAGVLRQDLAGPGKEQPTTEAHAALLTELRQHIADHTPSCNARTNHLLRRAAWALGAPRPAHTGGNAEDCPGCEGTNPPYPFICPGPDTNGEQPS